MSINLPLLISRGTGLILRVENHASVFRTTLVSPLRRTHLDGSVTHVLAIKLFHGSYVLVLVEHAYEGKALAFLSLLIAHHLASGEALVLGKRSRQDLLAYFIAQVAAIDTIVVLRPIGQTVVDPALVAGLALGLELPPLLHAQLLFDLFPLRLLFGHFLLLLGLLAFFLLEAFLVMSIVLLQ